VGGLQPAAPVQEPSQDRARDTERKVGDDVERAARQPEIGCVSTHDPRNVTDGALELGGTTGVRLYGDDAMTSFREGQGQRPQACADVEHQRTAREARRGDEVVGEVVSELVPSPATA